MLTGLFSTGICDCGVANCMQVHTTGKRGGVWACMHAQIGSVHFAECVVVPLSKNLVDGSCSEVCQIRHGPSGGQVD